MKSPCSPGRRWNITWTATAAMSMLAGLCTSSVQAQNSFKTKVLVSDGSVTANRTDPDVINPWGLAAGTAGAFWMANNGTGTVLLLNSKGDRVGSPINFTLPNTDALGAPTGVVFNATDQFDLSNHGGSGAALFMFASEDGTVAAWNTSVPTDQTVTVIDNTSEEANYKGLAILEGSNQSPQLYVANFHAGTVDVFDGDFNPVSLQANAFHDSAIPNSFAPFNIAAINNNLYVAYAQRDSNDDEVKGNGAGFVDVFDGKGRLVNRLIKRGHLNAPWAMVQAPGDFGEFSDALLVGNFGNGKIHAYDPQTGESLGVLRHSNGDAIKISGLWGLAFGNGAQAGPENVLFFAAGVNDEAGGAFGKIKVVSSSSSLQADPDDFTDDISLSDPTDVDPSMAATGARSPSGIK